MNGTSSYVMPSMAVIDTVTWTWKSAYTGAPVGSIWTTLPYVAPEGKIPGASSGLSVGATAGIGIGVAVALLAVGLGVFYWRRKKQALSNTTDANSDQPTKVKSETEGVCAPELIRGSGSDQNTPKGGLVARGGGRDDGTGLEINEKSSTVSTGPLSAATTLQQQTDQYTKGNSKNAEDMVSMDDTALAAALLQAEDDATQKPRNATIYNTSLPSSPIAQHQQPHTQYISGPFDQFKDDMIKPTTQFTYVSGPQSVPDSEALIERSSPGVPLHVIHARQVDQNGLYPPLTPARPHAVASSVIVGGPVTYPVHSPGAQGDNFYRPGLGPQAVSFSAAVKEANVQAMGGSTSAGAGSPSPRSPQLPYRDPQMMRDLDDITRMIQQEQEPKSPHTIVPPISWP